MSNNLNRKAMKTKFILWLARKLKVFEIITIRAEFKHSIRENIPPSYIEYEVITQISYELKNHGLVEIINEEYKPEDVIIHSAKLLCLRKILPQQ